MFAGAITLGVALLLVMRDGHYWQQKVINEAERNSWLYKNLNMIAFRLAAVSRVIVTLGVARFCLSLLLALLYWLLHLSILFWVIRVVGEQVGWAYVSLLQFAAMGVGHVSLSPGGVGVVEASAIAGLLPFMSAGKAALVIILWRLFTQYAYIVIGGCAFLLERVIVSRSARQDLL